MSSPRTGERNREIFVTFQSGLTIEELAIKYGLSPSTIRAILSSERHKLAVSPEYRKFREASLN